MTIKTKLAQGLLKQRFMIGLVRGMAGRAGPDGGRTVCRLTIEGFIVMAVETEPGLIFADIEEKAIGCPVWIMTSGAITLRNRSVDHLFFVQRIMTLVTEGRALFNQFKTFTTRDRMLRSDPGVAGETLSIDGGLMLVREGAKGLMALDRHTGIGLDFERSRE